MYIVSKTFYVNIFLSFILLKPLINLSILNYLRSDCTATKGRRLFRAKFASDTQLLFDIGCLFVFACSYTQIYIHTYVKAPFFVRETIRTPTVTQILERVVTAVDLYGDAVAQLCLEIPGESPNTTTHTNEFRPYFLFPLFQQILLSVCDALTSSVCVCVGVLVKFTCAERIIAEILTLRNRTNPRVCCVLSDYVSGLQPFSPSQTFRSGCVCGVAHKMMKSLIAHGILLLYY